MSRPSDPRPQAVEAPGSVPWTLFVAWMLVGVIALAGVPFVVDVVRGVFVWLAWVR